MWKKIITLFLLSLSLTACLQSKKPAPQPPSVLPQVSTNTDYNYAAIDTHALNAPASLRHDLPRLAAYLVKPARNDREKARAIFRWVTANIDYDADSYFRNDYTPHNTEDVLSSGKAVCDGYANLFKQLADQVGLETVMISGFTKGFSYLTRGRLGLVDHAWNAVKIDGQWQLLDSTWGAGYLNGRKKSFERRFKPHYFLTPPAVFIFDHFPDNPRWQLLTNQLSKKAFAQLTYLRSGFFKAGLELISHPQGDLQTRGNLTITLRAPKGSYISALLVQGEKNLPRSLVNLERQGELYSITPSFPKNGDYRLRIFAKRGIQAQTFDWALDYKISKF